MKASYAVILVHSTGYAIQLEKLLKKQQVECKLVPVPRHLSSDCGVCVRIQVHDLRAVEALIASTGLENEGIYRVP